MKAVEFPEHNIKIAEHQEEYETLPAFAKDGRVTVCFELDEEEKKQVEETGHIYLQFMTFDRPLNPIGTSVLKPFIEPTNQNEEE